MSYLMVSYEQAERIAAAMHWGERCRFCGDELGDMRGTVWGGDRWVHGACYSKPPIGRFVAASLVMLVVFFILVMWGV